MTYFTPAVFNYNYSLSSPLTIGVGFLHDCYNPFLGVGLVSQNKIHQPDFLRFLI
jgi:hypothetical protein